MSERTHDQHPGPWSAGAVGYAEQFEGFTALYVDDALDAVGVGAGTTMLDVAAGSGVVTAGALARGASVVATDFAEGMLTHLLARRAGPDGTPPLAAVMDGQHLAVVAGFADAAVSMFGVMFVPDPVIGIGEMRRATRAGGRVAVGTWLLDGFSLTAMVGEAVRRTVPTFERHPVVPTWVSLGSAAGLTETLEGAGLVEVECRTVRRAWHFTDPEGFFRSAPEWSPPMQQLFDALGPDDLDEAATNFATVVEEGSGADGIVTDALVASGTVPA